MQAFAALPATGASAGGGGVDPAAGAVGECQLCGDHCSWDIENEWMDRWHEWETRLAYYDKSLGPLMDEWWVPGAGGCKGRVS